MPELVIHFDPDSGVDADAVAKTLAQHSTGLENVESATSEVDHSRASLPDVLLVLTMATTVLTNSSMMLDALQKTIHALKGVAAELGLKNPRVEAGMAQVPASDLTEAQATQALSPT